MEFKNLDELKEYLEKDFSERSKLHTEMLTKRQKQAEFQKGINTIAKIVLGIIFFPILFIILLLFSTLKHVE